MFRVFWCTKWNSSGWHHESINIYSVCYLLCKWHANNVWFCVCPSIYNCQYYGQYYGVLSCGQLDDGNCQTLRVRKHGYLHEVTLVGMECYLTLLHFHTIQMLKCACLARNLIMSEWVSINSWNIGIICWVGCLKQRIRSDHFQLKIIKKVFHQLA